jgi:hypothetical protein
MPIYPICGSTLSFIKKKLIWKKVLPLFLPKLKHLKLNGKNFKAPVEAPPPPLSYEDIQLF